MIENEISGVLIDEATLTLSEFAKALGVDTTWIVDRVNEGLLGHAAQTENDWRFTSVELIRARRLWTIERDFDANPELAALVVDMLEEIQRLKRFHTHTLT